jgi:DNA-directed RNA polymerase specialized sigma24 family protein
MRGACARRRARRGHAGAGDEEAFRELTETPPLRAAAALLPPPRLGAGCRGPGAETLLAAWRSLETFEGRSSVRAWLYRIATNLCLNALRARSRRPQQGQTVADSPAPTRLTEPIWLEPYPTSCSRASRTAPRGRRRATRRGNRSSLPSSPFSACRCVSALALVLRDVLGFRTAEVAAMLDTGEGSVKVLSSHGSKSIARSRSRLSLGTEGVAQSPASLWG